MQELTQIQKLCNDEKAGCRLIIPGIESGNEQILKNIKKGSNLKLIREYMKNAKKQDYQYMLVIWLVMRERLKKLWSKL